MSLRDQVESLLPSWESWYPSVFDAAVDLGILRARVCSPGSLMLSQRHASVYNEALQAFREQWSAAEPEQEGDREASCVKRDAQDLESVEREPIPFDASRITRHASR